MSVTNPKPPTGNEEEARKARVEHNRRLLARAKLVAANVESIALGTTTATGTTSTKSPAESITGDGLDWPDTNMKKDLIVIEAKTDEAKKSNDAEEHKVEAGAKELPKGEKKASNAEETKKTKKQQAQSKKAEAKRKEGYNKFSPLLEESKDDEEGELMEEEDVEDDESESGKDQDVDVEDKRVDGTWFDAKYSCEERQFMQDLVAKIAEEAAAAKKKREQRKRKKKSMAEKRKERKEGKPNGSYPSIGVLCFSLVCIMVYSFIG